MENKAHLGNKQKSLHIDFLSREIIFELDLMSTKIKR